MAASPVHIIDRAVVAKSVFMEWTQTTGNPNFPEDSQKTHRKFT